MNRPEIVSVQVDEPLPFKPWRFGTKVWRKDDRSIQDRVYVIVEGNSIHAVTGEHKPVPLSELAGDGTACLVFELQDIRDGPGQRFQKTAAMLLALSAATGLEWAPYERKEP